MTVDAKICGITSPAALAAAARGGAAWVGLNFYPPSPRAVSPDQAATLTAALTAGGPQLVGLFVDPDDGVLSTTLNSVRLDLIQLHGQESPARTAEIRARFGLPVMKAISVAGADDLTAVEGYGGAADWLLFDAKPPKSMTDALPGGNALSFDWQLLAGRRWPLPWMLSGGLSTENVAEAVRISGARAVDVSSGVEAERGVKDPARITAFLECVQGL